MTNINQSPFINTQYRPNTAVKANNEAKKPVSSDTKTKVLTATTVGLGISTAVLAVKLGKVKQVLKNALDVVGESVPAKVSDMAEAVRNLASRDGMTGLLNKKTLNASLNKIFKEGVSKDTKLSVGMLDMDHFKSINEIFGHNVGDEFLIKIGKNIDDVAKKHNISSYRYGGEEFTVLMKDNDKESGIKIMQEIADAIKNDKDIQKYKDDFLKKASQQLAELKPKQEKLNVVFGKLNGKTPVDDYKAFAKDLQSMLVADLDNPNIANKEKKAVSEFIDIIHKTDEKDLPKVLTANLKSSDGIFLGNHLNSVHNKSREVGELESWISHVTANGFTISGGVGEVAGFTEPTAKKIINVADTALKAGKENGRNQIYTAIDDHYQTVNSMFS